MSCNNKIAGETSFRSCFDSLPVFTAGPSFPTSTAMFYSASLSTATTRAGQFGLIFKLFESFDELSNRLGLLVIQSRDALGVRCLGARHAFSYAFHQLICALACSPECGGLHSGLALATSTVATCTFGFVEGRAVRSP